jgi:hypothetical protein
MRPGEATHSEGWDPDVASMGETVCVHEKERGRERERMSE